MADVEALGLGPKGKTFVNRCVQYLILAIVQNQKHLRSIDS